MFSKVLLFAGVALSAVSMTAAATVGWSGEYSDEYGGSAFFCVDNSDNVQGMFSSIGMISGKVDVADALHMTGEIWEPNPAPNANTVFHGTFDLTLAADGLSFTGAWVNVDDATETGVWSGTNMNTNVSMTNEMPSAIECFAHSSTTSSETDGHYTGDAIMPNGTIDNSATVSMDLYYLSNVVKFSSWFNGKAQFGEGSCVSALSASGVSNVGRICTFHMVSETFGPGVMIMFWEGSWSPLVSVVFNGDYTMGDVIDFSRQSSASSDDSKANWIQGEYIDSDAHTNFICMDFSTGKVNSAYNNNAGITSGMFGTDQMLTGMIYEAVTMAEDYLFASTFSLTFNTGIVQNFTGSWMEGATAMPWTLTNVNKDIPTPAQCMQFDVAPFAPLAEVTAAIGGEYACAATSNVLDICASTASLKATVMNGVDTEDWDIKGKCDESGNICAGVSSLDMVDNGMVLARVDGDTQILAATTKGAVYTLETYVYSADNFCASAAGLVPSFAFVILALFAALL